MTDKMHAARANQVDAVCPLLLTLFEVVSAAIEQAIYELPQLPF